MNFKSILCILAGAILLVGCDPRIDKTATTSSKPNVWEVNIQGIPWRFTYIEVDDHQYLIFQGDRRGGITHSPKCPCLSTKVKENN